MAGIEKDNGHALSRNQSTQFFAGDFPPRFVVLSFKEEEALFARCTTPLRKGPMPIKMERVVEVRLVTEHSGELLKRGGPQHIQVDTLLMLAKQLHQGPGQGLKGDIPVRPTRSADDQQYVERFPITGSRRIEYQIRLTPHERMRKPCQIPEFRFHRVPYELPRQ